MLQESAASAAAGAAAAPAEVAISAALQTETNTTEVPIVPSGGGSVVSLEGPTSPAADDGPVTGAERVMLSPFLTQSPLGNLLQSHQLKMQQTSQDIQALGEAKNSLGIPVNVGARSQGRFRELSAANRPREDSFREITQQELEQHKSRSDCWIALDGVVYDISSYLRFHPGGTAILLSVAGKEAGREFRKHHPWVNYRYILENCQVGILRRDSGSSVSPNSTSPLNPTVAFPVPSGLPRKLMKDPLRLTLNPERAKPHEPAEPRTPQFGGGSNK